MTLYQVFIQYDVAYETTVNLGEAGIVEILDLHLIGSFHQRQFAHEIEICDEIERLMDIMRKELQKEKFVEEVPSEDPPAPYSTEIYNTEPTKTTDDERSLSLFWKLDMELKGMGKNIYNVKRNYLKYTEYKHIMLKTDPLVEEGGLARSSNDSLTRLLIEDAASGVKTVGFVAGVVLTEKVIFLQRVVWRICQGNVFFSHATIPDKIEDPDTGNEVFKSVFYAIYQGANLEHKVMKVCEGFKASVYDCPLQREPRNELMNEIDSALKDFDKVLNKANAQKRVTLETVAKNMNKWLMMIWKAKAVFSTMNKYQPDKMHKVFIAECWVPKCKLEELKKVLVLNQSDMLMAPVLVKIETEEPPPTFHDLNKFTRVFQDLVDAYGANSYQEHNPAPYYIITFPFLFSIMFGDAGHGVIMTLSALYLLYNEKNFQRRPPGGEIGRIFFAGRYIILLMGLFSIQSGLLYNDIFSKTTHFFRSAWHVTLKIGELARMSNSTFFLLDPEIDWDGTPYPFGLDPLWQMARNAIVFRNSLKMKMSIVFGVIHMLFGLLVGINNILFFKNYSQIFTMFIPEILFLSFLFLYLSILIVMKWLMYGPGGPQETSPGCAPSILNIFIGMVLFTDSPTPDGCSPLMYPHQKEVQLFLLLVALLCVPWLFTVKPILDIRKKAKEEARERYETREVPTAARLSVQSRTSKTSSTRGSVYYLDDLNFPNKFRRRSMSVAARGEPLPTEPYDFCQKYIHQEVKAKEKKRAQSLQRYSFPDKKLEKIEQLRKSRTSEDYEGGAPGVGGGGAGWENRLSIQAQQHKETNFDVFIHQAIHSIEFLLGTVSNTASYLRLWALSLAHEQLSHVVWHQLFGIALDMENQKIQVPAIIVIFLFWAVLSIAILVLMEGLSAFLHTLRLHWIEFQSKFYDGNGRIFQPFSLPEMLRQRET